MAKRKRLTPAQPDYLNAPLAAPEVKSALGPAPIAQVAGAASAIAALQEVTAAMRDARAEGRLVQRLPLASVAGDHLTRDRLAADAEDLDALVASIREHGQRNPIEVMELPDGRFGLISGWRRLTALEQLAAEPGGEKFATVLALLRTPENASDAYVSMVEENEIRVGLSYYERARVVALVVEQGVFPTEKIALARLFAAASRAKRSKIGSFLRVFHALDDVLRFPTHLGERQGLALAKALEWDAGASVLRSRLKAAGPARSPEEELDILQKALKAGQKRRDFDPAPAPAASSAAKPPADQSSAPEPARDPPAEPRPGVFLTNEGGYLKRRIVLSGPKVDQAFQDRLVAWLTETG